MVCNGVILPEKLPPTESAAHCHGYRVHLQVTEWKMLDEISHLNPLDWGWRETDGHLEPVATTKEIAPANILKVIRCNCKTTSKNHCGTNTCNCQKHGIKCMSACGGCHGENCNNKNVCFNSHYFSPLP